MLQERLNQTMNQAKMNMTILAIPPENEQEKNFE
jgi:hypothetical protein